MNENVFLSGAETDLLTLYLREDERDPGRGDVLDDRLADSLRLLAENPFMGPKFLKNVRRLVLRDWASGYFLHR